MITVLSGVLAGVAGGLVFLAIAPAQDVAVGLAKAVGGDGIALGLVVHIAASAVLGVAFALITGCLSRTPRDGALFGVAYGMLLWTAGTFCTHPWMVGIPSRVPVSDIGSFVPVLLAHVAYGATTGVFYGLLRSVALKCEEGDLLSHKPRRVVRSWWRPLL
jgi:hypothetical protein